MTPNEKLSAIALAINEAEVAAATIGERLAYADSLATGDFEALFDKQEAQKLSTHLRQCQATAVKMKERLAALHEQATVTSNTATFPRTRSGK